MPLDPMLEQMLAQMPAVPEGPIDFRAMRAMAAGAAPLLVGPDGPIEVGNVEETALNGPDGRVPIRVYRPAGKPVGTLHFIHGGGWIVGDLPMIDHTARRLCRDLSMVIVTSTYRLAPEHPFPAGFDDSLAAARWVLQHRAELGGDGLPVIIGGDSAGGNLAAAICIAMRDSGKDARQFDCQFLLYPAVDLRPGTSYDSRHRDADPSLPAGNLETYVAIYVQDAGRTDARLSPLAAPSLAGLPPALIVVLWIDPLRDEAVAYADRLREAGVKVDVVEFDNLTHGFVHFSGIIPAAATATDEVVARLKAML